MTVEEVLAKYGEVTLAFDHFYKYMFTYKGRTEAGEHIHLVVGGDSGDIYRWTVTAMDLEILNDWFFGDNWSPQVRELRITSPTGGVIYTHSGY